MTRKFLSTKTFTHSQGLSAAFRQWRADSHCKFLHGYALEIKVAFIADELDARNWVVDFGSLKSFKAMLENTFDHKTLVAKDDPEYNTFVQLHHKGLIDLVVVDATGCEKFAQMIFEYAEIWLVDNGYADRVKIKCVEVREHQGNSAIYMEDGEEV